MNVLSSDTTHRPSLEAPCFAVLSAGTICWKCEGRTPVAAVWVRACDSVDPDDEVYAEGDPAVLQYIEWLSADALGQVQALAPWLRYANTIGSGTRYLVNHCTACDSVQGDHYVFGPDGPFFPQSKSDLERINITPCRGALEATASPLFSSWMEAIKSQAARVDS